MDDFVLIQYLPAPSLAPRYESQCAGIVLSLWLGLHEIDNFIPPESPEVPVAFIMGSKDFITNTGLVADYYSRLQAPLSRNVKRGVSRV